MKKAFRILIVCIIIFSTLLTVSAESINSGNLKNISYTYNSKGEPYTIPSFYSYTTSITGKDIGLEDFNSISDIYYNKADGLISICDTGNNRVIILDNNYKVIKIISTFNQESDKLLSPNSSVIENNKLYIADTDNSRIVVFDTENWDLKYILDKPYIKSFDSNYVYSPTKIAVDNQEHIFVISKNITDGVILLDKNGDFISFFGAPKVKNSPLKEISKRFMTKTQRSKLYKSIPTEYTSIMVDSTGFVGLTTQSNTTDPISRMNFTGVNIFESKKNIPKGDEVYTTLTSTFVDLTEDSFGNYLALDNRKGKVFIYTKDGELLGCFGGLGNQKGTFSSAVSISCINDQIAIVDIIKNEIVTFDYTAFGENVCNGYNLISKGDFSQSKKYFDKAVSMCPGYLPAHLNIGRIALKEENYDLAASEFKYVGDKDYYSIVYKQIRTQFINNNFIYILGSVIIILFLIVMFVHFKNKAKAKNKSSDFRKKWSYVNHCCLHPFDGFWCVRREGLGSLKVANLLFLMFVIAYTLRQQFSAYLFNASDGDSAVKTLSILIPLALWVIVNWAISIFFDGKARLVDIYISTCYSLKPVIIWNIVYLIMSYVFVSDEAFILTIINSFVWIWIILLIFFSMIVVQDFSLSKGIVATVFTLLGIALIVFLSLVVINMSQDIISYFSDLFKEINSRN